MAGTRTTAKPMAHDPLPQHQHQPPAPLLQQGQTGRCLVTQTRSGSRSFRAGRSPAPDTPTVRIESRPQTGDKTRTNGTSANANNLHSPSAPTPTPTAPPSASTPAKREICVENVTFIDTPSPNTHAHLSASDLQLPTSNSYLPTPPPEKREICVENETSAASEPGGPPPRIPEVARQTRSSDAHVTPRMRDTCVESETSLDASYPKPRRDLSDADNTSPPPLSQLRRGRQRETFATEVAT